MAFYIVLEIFGEVDLKVNDLVDAEDFKRYGFGGGKGEEGGFGFWEAGEKLSGGIRGSFAAFGVFQGKSDAVI